MSALEHVLQEQAAKLDPTVAEYLNTVIQVRSKSIEALLVRDDELTPRL